MIKKVKKLYQINLNKANEEVEEEEDLEEDEEEVTDAQRMLEFLAGVCSATVTTCCEFSDEYDYDRNDVFESIIMSLRKFYHAVDLNDLDVEYEDDEEAWILEEDTPYGELS